MEWFYKISLLLIAFFCGYFLNKVLTKEQDFKQEIVQNKIVHVTKLKHFELEKANPIYIKEKYLKEEVKDSLIFHNDTLDLKVVHAINVDSLTPKSYWNYFLDYKAETDTVYQTLVKKKDIPIYANVWFYLFAVVLVLLGLK